MKKVSLLTISFFILFYLFFLAVTNYRFIVDLIPQAIKDRVPNSIVQIHSKISPYTGLLQFAISSETNLNDLLYNMEFLPNTHYGEIDFQIQELKFLDSEKKLFDSAKVSDTFVIDYHENNLIFATFSGNIFWSKLKHGNSFENKLNIKKIKNNLNDINDSVRVLDILIDDNDLLVSYFSESNANNGKKCYNVKLARSSLDIENLIFEVIYTSNECGSFIQAGRIQSYTWNNFEGYLLTVADNKKDYPNFKAQEQKSDFGKIIFIDKNSFEKKIFSRGHRNPQGLLVIDDIILETEHGPKGGDEINLINQGNNYGWPESSYGVSYNMKDLYYKKNHKNYGFTEPIFSFSPSIGISEIRKLPNNFWPDYHIQNNFFLTSLGARSIFQIKFDDEYSKVQQVEKIYIGQRIRDIVVIPEDQLIVLALERPGNIAILKPINK